MTTSNSANTKQSNNASQKRKPILLSYNSILCFYQLKMCSWGSRPYGLSP